MGSANDVGGIFRRAPNANTRPTTYRPEYVGALAHAPRSQTIALEPLDDQMSQLSTELPGKDRSVTGLADLSPAPRAIRSSPKR
jgi:hypothetical protein